MDEYSIILGKYSKVEIDSSTLCRVSYLVLLSHVPTQVTEEPKKVQPLDRELKVCKVQKYIMGFIRVWRHVCGWKAGLVSLKILTSWVKHAHFLFKTRIVGANTQLAIHKIFSDYIWALLRNILRAKIKVFFLCEKWWYKYVENKLN